MENSMKVIIKFALFITMLSTLAVGQNTAWDYSTKTAIDGKTTEVAITQGNEAASLIVRCSSTCDVYLTTRLSIVEDQASVRVKFNESTSLKRFAVSRGEGSDSLFFRDPMGVMKAIRDNGGYMTVEYSPYEKMPVMTKFGIWNLPPTMLKRLDTQKRIDAARKQQTRLQQKQCDDLLTQRSGIAPGTVNEETTRLFNLSQKMGCGDYGKAVPW